MRSKGLGFAAGAWFILAAAVIPRLFHIGAEELWLDEAFSFEDVTADGWPAGVRLRYVPPLYPVLLRAWIEVAGDSEAALRLLSALFGLLFVAATVWAARELFEARVALWSGITAAVSPMQVYYSQEARAYALLTALLAATYGLTWRALGTNHRRDWAFVALLVAAVLHTHYLGGLALVCTAAMVWARGARGQVGRYVAAMAIGAALFIPWVLWDFVLMPHPSGGVDWIRAIWARTPPLLAIPKSLEVLYLGAAEGMLPINLKQLDQLAYPLALRALGLATLAVLGLWAAAPWGAARLGVPRVERRVALLWTLLFGPLLALWAVSWLRPLYVVGRYDQLALPGFCLLVGFALGKLQARFGTPAVTMAGLALFVPVATKLLLYHLQPPANHAQSRAAAAWLTDRVGDGDLVLFTQLRGHAVKYQLHRLGYRWTNGHCEHAPSGRHFGCDMFPRELGPAPAPGDRERTADAPQVIRADLEEDLSRLAPGARSVFVVLGTYAIRQGVFSVLRDDVRLLEVLGEIGFERVEVDQKLGILAYRRIGTPDTTRPDADHSS